MSVFERRSVREGKGFAHGLNLFWFPPLANDSFCCTFAVGEGGNCGIRSAEIDVCFLRGDGRSTCS